MIDNYLTEYDDSISGESFRDPMGMQVIWSALGQRIFGWHITSRANNLRNFTQALFQHYVVREVEKDDSIETPRFARAYYGSKDDPRFKRSLIIFLENLFVYTAVQEDFDLSGILGSQSAKHKLQLFNEDPVICIHEDAGILVRQLFLGLNGSYKTPLMQLEILDGDYQYPDNEIWRNIENSFNQWEEARKLKDTLLEIIKQIFDSAGYHGRRVDEESLSPYRELTNDAASSVVWFRMSEIQDYKESLSDLYRLVLENPDGSRVHFGEFWKDQLGLNSGAARAIFESLSGFDDPYHTNNDDLLNKALEMFDKDKEGDATEREKIDDILTVEPLLGFMVSLFYLLCCRENHNLQDVAKNLANKEITEEYLQDYWNRIDWNRVQIVAQSLEDQNVFQTAGKRLRQLGEKLTEWDLASCLKNIIDYHKTIMEERGLYPWITLDDSGTLRHTGKGFALKNWQFEPWVHDYYLGAVKSIFLGLNGATK